MTLLLPKSQILMTPSFDSNTFSGLRSRWAIFLWCMPVSPFKSWYMYFYICRMLLWCWVLRWFVCFWLFFISNFRGCPPHTRRLCFGWVCPDHSWSRKNPKFKHTYLHLDHVFTFLYWKENLVLSAQLIAYLFDPFECDSPLCFAIFGFEDIACVIWAIPKQPEPMTLSIL